MKKTAIRLMAAAFLLSTVGVVSTACNTVEGVGEDVSTVGKGVSKGARKVKRSM